MAKKKKLVVKKAKSQEGTPTMVLLPARKFHFTVLDAEYKITVPRVGNYNQLAPEMFNEDAGAFSLLDDNNEIMYLPAISKVLFATEQYPDLDNNQLFAPIALVFSEDVVDIIGQIIEILPRKEPDAS